jgi:hypothetical protein
MADVIGLASGQIRLIAIGIRRVRRRGGKSRKDQDARREQRGQTISPEMHMTSQNLSGVLPD